jgi:hypothetical protein
MGSTEESGLTVGHPGTRRALERRKTPEARSHVRVWRLAEERSSLPLPSLKVFPCVYVLVIGVSIICALAMVVGIETRVETDRYLYSYLCRYRERRIFTYT